VLLQPAPSATRRLRRTVTRGRVFCTWIWVSSRTAGPPRQHKHEFRRGTSIRGPLPSPRWQRRAARRGGLVGGIGERSRASAQSPAELSLGGGPTACVHYVIVTCYAQIILWGRVFRGNASLSATRRNQAIAGIVDSVRVFPYGRCQRRCQVITRGTRHPRRCTYRPDAGYGQASGNLLCRVRCYLRGDSFCEGPHPNCGVRPGPTKFVRPQPVQPRLPTPDTARHDDPDLRKPCGCTV
jgi:hypothetical protein